MTTSFPTGLDALTNPTGSSSLTSPDHASQHADANDAIEALEAKVGVNGSAVTTSLDYKITNINASNLSSGTVPSARVAGAYTGVTSVGTLGSLTVTNATTSGSFIQGTDYLSPHQGFRNKIINGSFEFWQRGTARTFMQAGQYLADRWTVRQYQQNAHQRTAVTPVAGMQTRYALRSSSSTTAEVAYGTRMWSNTVLESAESIPLRGKTITLSFWVRFSSATCSSSTAIPYGNWVGSIEWCTSTTDGATGSTGVDGGSGVTLTNGSLPTVWTKYTVSGTVPSTANNVGVGFGFAGLGSTALADTVWYEVTQVQLEVGSVATPFEQRPMQTELALCQRYYQKSYDVLTTPATSTEAGQYTFYGTSNVYALLLGTIQLKVPMRVTPTTITYYSSGGTVGIWAAFNTNGTALSPSMTTVYSGNQSFSTYASIAGSSYIGGGMYGHWTASAEL